MNPHSAELPVVAASFAQQRLWFLDRFEPGSATYNVPLAVRFRGPLDRRAVERALAALAARHETLRSTFLIEDGAVLQAIHPEGTVDFRVAPVADEAALAAALAAEGRRAFDLVAGPLWRTVLLARGAEDHVLLLTLHHIVSDGWSLGVLIREFSHCYAAYAAGAEPALPELEIQYADFAAWQREQWQGGGAAAQVEFWRRTLAGAPTAPLLTTDRPRGAVMTTAGRTHRFELDAALTGELKTLAQQAGASLFMMLLGGFAALLRCWSGRDDLVIGTPVANRQRRELEPLVGFFVNTLPLRLDLTGNPSGRALLGRVRTMVLEALSHQDVPFEQLVQELQPERTLGHAPLFQVMFALQNTPAEALRLPGLTAAPVEVDTGTTKFDLTLALEEAAGRLVARLEYNSDLFDDATVERFAAQYGHLLRELVRAPAGPIGELRLQSEAAETALLHGWNATARPYPERGLAELFGAQAARAPQAVAVRFRGQDLTYGELEARANRLAHLLRARGVRPDDCVPVCVERSPELIVALLAIVKAGGAYVALDPEYPAERLAAMIADVGAGVLVVQEKFAAQLGAAGARHPLVLERAAAEIAAQPASDPAVRVTLGHLAYVSFTSGSTGRPKGVAVPQRGVVRLVQNPDFAGFGAGDTFLQLAPVAFDASTLEIWGPLLNGGRLVVMPPGAPTLEALGAAIRDEGVTTLWLTAGLFHLMVDERLDDLRGVRQLLAGGDVLSVAHVRKFLRGAPACRLINGYGPTENTTFTCCHAIAEADLAGGSVPIGRPIANTRVYILDAALRPVPIGVPGELYTGGDGLARGYLHRPELTAEKFVPDPFSKDRRARLYRTGDRVRWRHDGAIEFLGRLDQQVKIRGYRVEPAEAEAALAAEPGVQAAAVVVREDGGQKRLVGYVAGAGLDGEALRARLQAKLPEYLVPAVIVRLDALPLTANGKVDRAALPAPESPAAASVAPRTPAEEILAHLWARVLGVERVGAEDNFFALGGHSLLATQLVTRMREAFGVELPLRALFEAPTVRALAARIAAARDEQAAAAPPLRLTARPAELPLSFAQERLWFLNQLEPGNPFYNMPAALRLDGAFDVRAAERVVAELVRRHESLRTVFAAVDGRPVQVIRPDASVPVTLVELQHLEPAARAAAAQRWSAEEARRPFDLARGPLLRVALLRLGADEHLLLMTMHHIVSDGWSMGVLTREMGELYAAFSQARATPLPELALHYVDFAVWQRGWLRGAALEAQLAYWRQQLAGAPPVLKLPTDRPRPPVQSFRGGSHAFRVGRDVTEALRALSRATGATLFMTLEAAFAAVLARYSDQEDIVVGTPIANRHRAEVEPLIGFFVNTLVLRNDLTGAPTFRELLTRVRRAALDAYAHQDLPFERLVDELQPERDLSRNPLFQVMFALHNTPHRERALPGLTITDLAAERISAQFDLVLDVWETPDGLKAVLEFATDLFDPPTIERLAGHFATLLAGAAAAPDTPVAQLPLLTAAERAQLLDTFNATAMPYPHDRTLQSLIEEQVAAGPERIAAVHRDQRITYAALDRAADRLARRLRALGVGRGHFVGILDERGIDFLTAMVAILKAGGAFIPIDPGYPEERVRHMVSDSAVAVLITRSTVLKRFTLKGEAGVALQHFVLLDEHTDDATEAVPAGEAGAPTDAAYMLYTSGSTGAPKGAIIRQNGAVNHIYGQFRALAFHRGSAFLQSAPSSSDISVWQFLAPLLIGGRTVIADFETVCDAAQLFRLVRGEGLTLIELVPVVLKEFLDHAAARPPAERALPALEFAMVTGEAVSVALVNQWFQVYPGLRLVNAYGPTEAADDVCQAILTGPLPPDAPTVPIGRTLGNLTMYVLDRHLQLVPLGVPGELCVSGVGVGAGYWRNEEKTRAAFVANPHDDTGRRGAALYRTGDLGRWRPDGELEMLGRFDQQVKLRGFRIELGEIESRLSQHPAVAEAVVLIREDTPGDRRLVAYATTNDGADEWRAKRAGLAGEQVQLWQDLHEDSYADTLTYADGDATFNVIGWDSNYTGEPLSEREMREYVAHTVERVRELQPRRVLEIGCGTGLLLFRLAPEVERYLATDLSEVAIARLERQVGERAGLGHVELRAQRADDFSGIEPGSVDVVMLCSVIQYFPGIDYLLAVIDGALRVLRPGGAIFLGDVRVRGLLPAFHAAVQLHKAGEALTVAGLRRRVRAALHREQEMAVEPAFFAALRARQPRIARVQVRPKRGTVQNEMTRFRCDVTLHLDKAGVAPEGEWIDWPDRPCSLADLKGALARGPATLALRGVVNSRVQRELATLWRLENAAAGERVADFRARLDADEIVGLEPEDLVALGAETGYAVDTAVRLDAWDGSYDVVFRRRPAGGAPLPALDLAPAPGAPKPWRSYASNPLHEKLARELVPQLRSFLRERLPTYMVPADFVVLEAMPQLPNGKVDRKALPAPDAPAAAESDYVAPRNAIEAQLAAIWSAVLGLERVSVHANFFELGGHSLKATQVVSRIARELGIEVALREMFSQPTIAELMPTLDVARRTAYEPIPRVTDTADYALSHAQLRLWVLAQLEGALTAYNMPASLLLEGRVDRAAIDLALAALVRRHESLRTTFVVVDGAPRQRVHAAPLGGVEFIDVSGERDPAARAKELAFEHARRPFDLERGPLLRITLVRLEPESHALLFNLHHIVSDDWSMGVLVNEFVRLHDAHASGAAAALPPLRLHYRDYAAWQNARLAADGMAAHRDYWRARFAGALPVLDLSTDFPRPAVKTYHGRTRAFTVPVPLTRALHELARGERATLFMVLTAAVQALLHRHTDQRDIIIGSPIAGRNHPDLEDQIGFYINTLPLRATIDPQAAFTTLLAQVRQTATEAYEHQAYPFDRLVDDLALARDVTRTPLFDVVVVMQNVDAYTLVLDGVTVKPFVDDFGGSKFDLQFNFEERDGELRGSIVFNTDLFAEERIVRLITHLTTLLGSIVADPARAVGQLELLPGEERRQVLEKFQGPPGHWPRGRTLGGWFEAQAARTLQATAITDEAGAALTYAELNAAANRLAHALRKKGVGPEVLVGMYFERGADLVIGQLAIVKAGGAYVPFDPVYPAERIAYMLGDAKPRVLLTQTKHTEFCRGLINDAQTTTELLCVEDESLRHEPETNPSALTQPDHAAYVIYTSGSTGRPKGCIIPHYQVVRLFEATEAWYGFNGADVWTFFHSYAFDFSVWEIWGALLYGGRLVIVPHATSRSPEIFLELLRREQVTVLNQTPSAFRQLIAADEATPPNTGPLTLRYVIFGGEALDLPSLRPWWDRHGDVLPKLVNMYGITETTVHVSYRPLSRADLEVGGSVIGGPIPDLKIYLLDAFRQPVPIGVTGEIYVGGAGVARGYLNRPELTAERFVPNPFSNEPPATLYRSGDLARWRPNGELEYLGRADHQVKIRGFRIELGEIEAAFVAHPAVRSVLVLVREDRPGDKRLAAYFLWRGEPVGIGELRTHMRSRVPDYMVPADFVALDAFPLTNNGKIDRRALPAPDGTTREPEVVFVAPRTPQETAVAAVWAEVLGLERVGANDNFFELGGHSLKATQVVARLRAQFAAGCTIAEVFRRPTLEAFAAGLVAAAPATPLPAHPEAEAKEGWPLSTAQRRLWIIDRMMPGLAVYNIATALQLDGALNVPALQQALHGLVARHESLRTTFAEIAGEPRQIVGPAGEWSLREIDLSGARDPLAEARALAAQEAAAPFDLAQGPLWRVTLIRLAPQQHLLLSTLHHIVSDAWSADILRRELTNWYEAAVAQRPDPLPPLAIQYRDFARDQNRRLSGPEGGRMAAVWRQRLGGERAVLALPTDFPRPAVQTAAGRTTRFALGRELSDALGRLGQAQGATGFMTLLALVKLLLARYTGQDDISVGSPVAGRERVEAEGLIGFFVNTLVLRDTVARRDTFATLLARVRATCLEAFENQAYPFDRLVDDLKLERDFSRSPLFDVSVQLLEEAPTPTQVGGLRLAEFDHGFSPAKCDLSFDFTRNADGFACSLTWHADLFTAARIDRLVEHLGHLARAVVGQPQCPLGELELLSPAERHRLLVDFNPPPSKAKPDTLTAWFAREALARPNAIAVRSEGAAWTFAELEGRARRLAHALRARGVARERVVAVALERGLAWAATMLAVMKAGGIYLPIDPSLPRARIATMLQDSGAVLVVTSRALRPVVAGPTDVLVLEDVADELAAAAATAPGDPPAAEDGAYLIYTSGSTGQPKGVLVEHRGIVNTIQDQVTRLRLSPADRVLQFASISFDASLFETWNAWLSGAALVIAPNAARHDPGAFRALLRAEGVTVAVLPPSFVRSLGRVELPLRMLFTAGEAADTEDARHYASRLTYVNGYGPTEAAICSTVHFVTAGETAAFGVPIGTPLANTRAYVLDADRQLAPIGVPGELWVAGRGLARGYWARPELTAERFATDPFVAEARMYRTGDLCRWRENGVLEFLGRADAQVKLRGFRIELGEIEAALLECPGVQEAAVLLRHDLAGGPMLVGYVVAGAAAVDTAGLGAALREKLPDYMVPAAFVPLPALPLTTAGKIDRRALPAPALAPVEQVAPRDDVERALAEIFREVLRLPRVGAHDPFFQIGGNSLLAIQVITRVRDTFKVEVAVPRFFDRASVAGLAETLRTEPTKIDQVEKIARTLARLAAMSPEEKQRLLAQRRAAATKA